MERCREWGQDGCQMRLYGGEKNAGTVLWLIGKEEAPWLGNLPEDAAVIAVSGMDWDRDLTPWPAPAAFRGQAFSGGADAFLKQLTEDWMPKALSAFDLSPVREGILGYSLAGLFSLYALCRCGRFRLTASVSGSLWYDGFLEWLETHPPVQRAERLYFSVGDRERKARNPRMARVEDCTRQAAEWAQAYADRTVFELQPGGHFDQPDQRVLKAVRWLLGAEAS